MSSSLRDFLRHILAECNYILRVTEGKTKEDLFEDETLERALTRSIEIIGEAVKKLDDDFRVRFPRAEWKRIAGARDWIVHHYYGIDYDIIWEIISEKILPLRDYIEDIIWELEEK